MTQTTERPEADCMVTVAEACRQLGIGRTTFYKLVNTRELEAVNLNAAAPKRLVGQSGPRRSIRVPQSAIDAYKKSHQA